MGSINPVAVKSELERCYRDMPIGQGRQIGFMVRSSRGGSLVAQ